MKFAYTSLARAASLQNYGNSTTLGKLIVEPGCVSIGKLVASDFTVCHTLYRFSQKRIGIFINPSSLWLIKTKLRHYLERSTITFTRLTENGDRVYKRVIIANREKAGNDVSEFC